MAIWRRRTFTVVLVLAFGGPALPTKITFEVIATAALLRNTAPELRVRIVNVTDFMILGPLGSHSRSL